MSDGATSSVRENDVFEDLDYRNAGRRVVVTGIIGSYALVQRISGGPKTRIRLNRLRPITPRKGYKLVQSPSCEACAGNVADGKSCYACGVKGPVGQGVAATTEAKPEPEPATEAS